MIKLKRIIDAAIDYEWSKLVTDGKLFTMNLTKSMSGKLERKFYEIKPLMMGLQETYVCKFRRYNSGCRCPCQYSTGLRASGPGCYIRDAGTEDNPHCTRTTKPTRTTCRRRRGRSGCKTFSEREGLRSRDHRWRVRAGRRFLSVFEPRDRTSCYTQTTRPMCSIFRELKLRKIIVLKTGNNNKHF